MNKPRLTAHMIVKNEEQWIWYAVSSVLPLVDKIIIFDTGSGDQTVEIIKTIRSKKVQFLEKGSVDANGLVALRNEQIKKTKTDWFLIVDGDEVWQERYLKEIIVKLSKLDKKIMAIFTRTFNCVGDVYHVLPESAGKYEIAGIRGHLNIRFFRVSPQYSWRGTYPLEAYQNEKGEKVNDFPTRLYFFDKPYWHMTHMVRSSLREEETVARKGKHKFEFGVEIPQENLPKIFFKKRPKVVPSPWVKPNKREIFQAFLSTPLKRVKRLLPR